MKLSLFMRISVLVGYLSFAIAVDNFSSETKEISSSDESFTHLWQSHVKNVNVNHLPRRSRMKTKAKKLNIGLSKAISFKEDTSDSDVVRSVDLSDFYSGEVEGCASWSKGLTITLGLLGAIDGVFTSGVALGLGAVAGVAGSFLSFWNCNEAPVRSRERFQTYLNKQYTYQVATEISESFRDILYDMSFVCPDLEKCTRRRIRDYMEQIESNILLPIAGDIKWPLILLSAENVINAVTQHSALTVMYLSKLDLPRHGLLTYWDKNDCETYSRLYLHKIQQVIDRIDQARKDMKRRYTVFCKRMSGNRCTNLKYNCKEFIFFMDQEKHCVMKYSKIQMNGIGATGIYKEYVEYHYPKGTTIKEFIRCDSDEKRADVLEREYDALVNNWYAQIKPTYDKLKEMSSQTLNDVMKICYTKSNFVNV